MPNKPRVLITDNIHPQAVAILEDTCDVIFEAKLSHEELIAQIGTMDALMIRSASTVSADVLEKAHKLRIIGRAGVGTDNIDVSAATKKGVIVINSPEGNTVAASEHTIGMLMALARHIPQGDATLKNKEWIRSKLVGVEVYGKSLGIVGLGKIGRRVAKTCLALGMKVSVFDPFLSKTAAEELGVAAVSFDEILAKSDFITIHAPKTRETENLFNTNTLKQCKPGVRLINCARGGIINEADLAQALIDGHVAGAALDVFSTEPLSLESPLLALGKTMNNVVLTPHLGASTEEAQVNVALDVAEQIREFFLHGFAKSAVNIPLLRPDMVDPVKHFLPMAEVLGNFIRQRAVGATQSLEIIAKGDLAEHRIEPLGLAVLKGMLSTAHEGVNYVNAPGIAEENGIRIQQATTSKAGNYRNVLEVILQTEDRKYTVSGTLISDEIFRIVSLDDYQMALKPTEHILLTPHVDQPGMIASVATVLGKAGVNISAMQVARQGLAAGGESLMVFNLDNEPPAEVLKEMRQIQGIHDSLYIHLPAQKV